MGLSIIKNKGGGKVIKLGFWTRQSLIVEELEGYQVLLRINSKDHKVFDDLMEKITDVEIRLRRLQTEYGR